MSAKNFLAFDLGAESGRLMMGGLEGGILSLEELHRFPNLPERRNGSLCWKYPQLLAEVENGLRKAGATGLTFSGISTDSWGVDYVLMDEDRRIMEPVYHYRDARSKEGVKRALGKLSWEKIFNESGIQFMPINTLFQLAAEEPGRLERAAVLLGIGDAVNHFLCGAEKIEVSMASTFQLYNPRLRGWSKELLEGLGLPTKLLPEIVPSASVLGAMRKEVGGRSGLGSMPVIATCSHDTGAAVVGVPGRGKDWAYLSSGTWSLMGVELDQPIFTEQARELNFTNEIGFGHSVRFLKNISGLWLVQECRRQWGCEGKDFDYGRLTEMAGGAEPFRSLIDPGADEFLAPANMPAQIQDFCRRTKQRVPETEGALVRCALESLALLYRRTLKQLELITGRKIERLHIVGGGSNNALLNQFAADATGARILAGPSEATAMGNILLQAIALGELSSLESAREVVARSAKVQLFEPRERPAWEEAFKRFEQFPGRQDAG